MKKRIFDERWGSNFFPRENDGQKRVMQIRSVMTSYSLQLKGGKYGINDVSAIIEAVFLKLGIINVHHKRNKMTPLVLLA